LQVKICSHFKDVVNKHKRIVAQSICAVISFNSILVLTSTFLFPDNIFFNISESFESAFKSVDISR